MKNILIIENNTVQLLTTVNDGSNTLFINDIEIPSSYWVGSGSYNYNSRCSIEKAPDLNSNYQLVKDSETEYHFQKVRNSNDSVDSEDITKLIEKLELGTYSRVKLFSEVDANTESENGYIYIDASDIDYPKFRIGDGNAYIVDLPIWNIGEINDVLKTLKEKSITANIEQETLLLPYIYS